MFKVNNKSTRTTSAGVYLYDLGAAQNSWTTYLHRGKNKLWVL